MENIIKRCIYCNYHDLYEVSPTQKKCKKCGKKFSVKRLETEKKIISLFCQNKTALEASETLHVNYKTLLEKYGDIRKILTHELERLHQKNYGEFSEYEEYYYLPKQKRGKIKYLFDAIGILGMLYQDRVFTLVLPDQFSHLKDESLSKETNFAYMKEYARYLNRYKIIHYKKFDNKLIEFWVFLEKELEKFKGVSKENFIYYLKECEFKFNFEEEQREDFLWKIWLEHIR